MFSNREFQNSDFIDLPYRLGGAKRPGRDGRFQVIDDETNLANLHPSNPSSSLKQTDGIPTRLFSTSTVAIQRSRKTWPPKPRIKSFSHRDLPPWHSYVPGPEWAGCPGSVVLIDVHGNYELRCSQKCHTSTRSSLGRNPREKESWRQGMGPFQPFQFICQEHWFLRIHHTIHIVSFLKLLTRWTMSYLPSLMKVSCIWNLPFVASSKGTRLPCRACSTSWRHDMDQRQNDEYMEGWKVSSLTLTVALRALRSTWTTSMSCCNTWQVAMAKTLQKSISLILELKWNHKLITSAKTPRSQIKWFMQNAKAWKFMKIRVPAWLVKVKRQFILQDIADGGSGAKTSTFLNTLWDCLILSIFHAQKWKRTLETTGQLLQNIPLTACFLESDMLRMLRIIDSKK